VRAANEEKNLRRMSSGIGRRRGNFQGRGGAPSGLVNIHHVERSAAVPSPYRTAKGIAHSFQYSP
jgi:hypothetical protein